MDGSKVAADPLLQPSSSGMALGRSCTPGSCLSRPLAPSQSRSSLRCWASRRWLLRLASPGAAGVGQGACRGPHNPRPWGLRSSDSWTRYRGRAARWKSSGSSPSASATRCWSSGSFSTDGRSGNEVLRSERLVRRGPGSWSSSALPARRTVEMRPGRWFAMRARRLNRWIAGGLAGCPGIVDVSPTDGSPPSKPAPLGKVKSAADDRAGQHSPPQRLGDRSGSNTWLLTGVVLRRWPSGRKRER